MRSIVVTLGLILLGVAAYLMLIPTSAEGFNCGSPLHAAADPAAAASLLCAKAIADHRQLAIWLSLGGVGAIVVGMLFRRAPT